MNINQKHHESLTIHERLAIRITKFVGSMWCAYLFALLACISLPDAIKGGIPTFIPWVAQTFLQLVLLSIIMVGQNLQQKHQELIAESTYRLEIKSEKELGEINKKLDAIISK